LACTKYPPSLLFVLMTLGPALVALALADRPACALSRPVITFGRVPLFYYLVHFPLIHAAAVVLALARHRRADRLFAYRGPNPPLPPPRARPSPPRVYL